MLERLCMGLMVTAAALSPAALAAQGKVASMLPPQPQTITVVNDDYESCSETRMLFIGVGFEVWNVDGPMNRVAEQAAAAYADPANLLKFDNDHRFIRAIEVRDYAGLQGFLRSIMDDDSLNSDVMIGAIPPDKRFASVEEQIEAWEEIYLHDVVELGAKRCPSR